jgi:hypothetical protein
LVSFGGKQYSLLSDFYPQQQSGLGYTLDTVRFGYVGYLMLSVMLQFLV